MSDIDYKPSIVIVSSSNTKPKSLIKLITRTNSVFENDDQSKVWLPWTIDTKYYTAEVNIYGITDEFTRTDKFNNTVEAMIVHMDSNKDSGLRDVEKWLTLENDCNPEIKLLIANYCTNETKVSKVKAIEWCLKKGFEFIELYPTNITSNSDWQDTEIIKETTGVERIIEAVQTHVWPNLIMKKSQKADSTCKGTETMVNLNVETPTPSALDTPDLSSFLTDEGTDDFTELFSQLHMIKDSMKSMPVGQRKQCAEQMVTAFWRAIGGDEEEIADI